MLGFVLGFNQSMTRSLDWTSDILNHMRASVTAARPLKGSDLDVHPRHHLDMSDSQATSQATAHSHDHHHGHGYNFATENQKFFDEQAKEYDARPDVQTTASRAAGAMRREFPTLFDDDSTTVMDYACGTGTIFSSPCVINLMLKCIRLQERFLASSVPT